jgi:predicted MPP superfamily phosphohydrolase
LGLKRIWPGLALAAALNAGYIALIWSGLYTRDNAFTAALYNGLGLLFVFHGYLFAFLFLALPLTPWLKKISGRKIAALGALISMIIVIAGFVGAQSFKITEHEIKIRGLGRPVSIMHVSDLHLGPQRGKPYLEKITAAIERYNPDIVLYSGDLVDSDIALKPEIFQAFKSVRAEQYYTVGNHEYYADLDKALDLIKKSGLVILRNRLVETRGLQLIGLEYMRADRKTFDHHRVNDLTIEEELPKIGRKDDKPVILVQHSPVGLGYLAQGKIDVLFAGHTHGGGQVFPVTLLAGLQFPVMAGLYQFDGMWVLVSQGAGTFGPWMRLGTFNEIQFVRLTPTGLTP